MQIWGLVFAILASLVTGCSNTREQGNPAFRVPVLDKERKAFLENFPLLDEQGEMRPPVVDGTNQWPMGALLYMSPNGEGFFCSASHISSGKVAANAHCILSGARAHDYFVIYYDRSGKKQYDRIRSFDYQGNTAYDDIAIFSMTNTDERRWHVLNSKFIPTQGNVGVQPPATMPVSVWAFDPIAENHPELFRRYHSAGMMFAPRHCLASRTAPSVVGVMVSPTGLRTETRVVIDVQEKVHLMIDACDKPMVKGNSGSLISENENFSRVLGVYHWIVMPRIVYSSYLYRGNSGAVIEKSAKEVAQGGVFGVGTAFEAAFERKPALLNFFQNWTFEYL